MSMWGDWKQSWEEADERLGLKNSTTKHKEAAMKSELNDQINAYKEQTRIAKEETDRKRGEQAAEKRRINEKQIRTLRRNYRPAGFLNNAASAPTGDLTQNLGG